MLSVRKIWNFVGLSNKTSYNMLGQRKISDFFNSGQQKRVREEDDREEKQPKKLREESSRDHQSPTKAASHSEADVVPSTPPQPQAAAIPLTPEQKAKMEENRLAAKMKLVLKNTHGVVDNMGPSWFKALETEFGKAYFIELCKFVEGERRNNTVYPPPKDVFTFTRVCEIRKVRVVILGQDPYHGPRQAHGLCFSVQKGVAPPPSLENMYKELGSDIEGFQHPGHGDLTGWAKQGVLLLNACLTVRARNANSHANKGWEQFTDATIAWLNRNLSGVVFMLWGSYAQKKGAQIDKKKHHILKAVHPSPLSAYRGFFGCKHFSQANKLLKQQGRTPIDWTDLPQN